jgi:hypothetical protein
VGAWGNGLYDDDTALDIQDDLDVDAVAAAFELDEPPQLHGETEFVNCISVSGGAEAIVPVEDPLAPYLA